MCKERCRVSFKRNFDRTVKTVVFSRVLSSACVNIISKIRWNSAEFSRVSRVSKHVTVNSTQGGARRGRNHISSTALHCTACDASNPDTSSRFHGLLYCSPSWQHKRRWRALPEESSCLSGGGPYYCTVHDRYANETAPPERAIPPPGS